MRAGEAISCVMITGHCSSHSHRQRDRQMEVDFEGWNIWEKCCKQTAQMGLLTQTCSMLSIDPEQQRADTDSRTLSHTFILFSVDLNREEQSLAKAETPPCGSYVWSDGSHTGAFYSVTGLKPTEPGVATYQFKWSTERVRCMYSAEVRHTAITEQQTMRSCKKSPDLVWPGHKNSLSPFWSFFHSVLFPFLNL